MLSFILIRSEAWGYMDENAGPIRTVSKHD